MSKIKSLMRRILHKSHVEQELDQEVLFYLESLTQERIEAGMNEQEARRSARLELGSVASLKEAVRDARTGAFMEQIWQDLRYAIRALRSKPGFTASAVLVLALGIGCNSAIFSLVNAFLLKPIAIDKPEELRGLFSRDTKHPGTWRAFSYPNYVDIRANNPVFSSLMAQNMAMVGLREGDHTRRIFAGIVSSNYFSTLGVPICKGRPFLQEEEKPGDELPVIVTYSYWRKTGEDARILGKQLSINGRLFTVVGITPEGFTGTMALLSPEIFVPLGAYNVVDDDALSHNQSLAARDNNALILVGRLKPDVTQEGADAKLTVVASRMEKAFPAENKNQLLLVRPLSRLSIFTSPTDDRELRAPAILLLSLAAVVLLIASLNVSNMMLAKGSARRKELAIRLAIGGTRRRIVQQLVTEALVLAVLCGGAGLLVSAFSSTLLIRSLRHLVPLDIVYSPAPDARVLIFTLVFCMASTVVFGLFPAWKLSRPDLGHDLKEDAGENKAGHRRRLFSLANMVVIAQLSLSLMMLAAAGLFVHSALRAAEIHPGFSLENEVVAEVDAGLSNYDEARGRQLYRTLQNRLRQLPGVQSIAMAATVPFGMAHLGKNITNSDFRASTNHPATAVSFNIVTDDYFRTLGIPLLRGRSFSPAENLPETKSHVAIIDKLAADKLWLGASALGRHIRLDTPDSAGGPGEVYEVVGVVGNVRERILGGKTTPHLYFPFGEEYQSDIQIHVNLAAGARGDEAQMLKTIGLQIRATDERLPLLSLRTMREHLESSLEIWVVRTGADVLEIFGAVALLLGAIGLYAVNAYTVARRTREIGIRMAVGADASSTQRMILADGLRVIAVGLGIGLLLAIGLGRALSGFLYDIPGADPLVLLTASAVLALVALFACYLPARRASQVDPLIALRYE